MASTTHRSRLRWCIQPAAAPASLFIAPLCGPSVFFFFSPKSWRWSQRALQTAPLHSRVPPLRCHCLNPFVLQFCSILQSLLGSRAKCSNKSKGHQNPPKALSILLTSHKILLLHEFTASNRVKREKSERTSDLTPVSGFAPSLNSVSYFNCAHWSLTQALVRIIFAGVPKHSEMFQLNFSASCHTLSSRATEFMGRFCHSSYP